MKNRQELSNIRAIKSCNEPSKNPLFCITPVPPKTSPNTPPDIRFVSRLKADMKSPKIRVEFGDKLGLKEPTRSCNDLYVVL